MLFSATSNSKFTKLATRVVGRNFVKITQGTLGTVNKNVIQQFSMCRSVEDKLNWLPPNLTKILTDSGSVLIFVNQKAHSESVSKILNQKGFTNQVIHGDISQITRNEILNDFKSSKFRILVATDLASRGLDIPQIQTIVIEYYFK